MKYIKTWLIGLLICLIASPAFGAAITDKSIGGLIDVLELGETDEMYIGGGGTGNVGVWTTATGTGAPVRAVGPTFTGSVRMTLAAGSPFIAGGTDIATLSGVSISNANPSVLTKDATIDDGLAVNDAVIVNSGTNATVGTYIVAEIAANTSVTLDRQAATGVCNDGNITYVNDPLLMVTPATVFLRQIAFPATAVPSADANTLDDYEEGIFEVAATMTTSGTVTLNGAIDTIAYVKIGRQVTVTGHLAVDSVDAPVGELNFSLPFTVSGGVQNSAGVFIGTYDVDFTSGTYIFGYCQASAAVIRVKTSGDGIGYGNVVPTATDEYFISGSYFM